MRSSISGEIDMELDDNVVVKLKAGDALVQRGTIHNWVNRGTEDCVIAFVLISAKPATASGANAIGFLQRSCLTSNLHRSFPRTRGRTEPEERVSVQASRALATRSIRLDPRGLHRFAACVTSLRKNAAAAAASRSSGI